jgi:hypothetical protein
MSSDSVAWEVSFLRVSNEDDEFHTALWQVIDEQFLPVNLRQQLESNGFRCGVVGVKLPTALRERLDEQHPPAPDESTDGSEQRLSLGTHQWRLQPRAGHRREIITSPKKDRMIMLSREDDGQLRGTTYHDAHCLLALRSYPHGDGQVRLELTPEVHFGPTRQRYTVHEGALQMQAGRDRKVLDQLQFETRMSAGQTLLLTSTRQPKGPGRQFFLEDTEGQLQQKILLIRLAQTQYDNLFVQEEPVPSLTTKQDGDEHQTEHLSLE